MEKLSSVFISLLSISVIQACHESPQAAVKITNGIETEEYTGVLLLESSNPGSDTASLCTASLIKPTILLTAAHCVIDHKTNQMRDVMIDGSGASTVVGMMIHPEYAGEGRFDVALIRLDRPVPDAQIMSFVDTLPQKGERVKLVGFGGKHYTEVRGKALGSGIKRYGFTTVSHMDDYFIYSKGIRYAKPEGEANSTGEDVGVAPGDSGGPLLDAKGRIIGIAARANSQSIDAKEKLSIVGAHTQIRAVLDFIVKYQKELGE